MGRFNHEAAVVDPTLAVEDVLEMVQGGIFHLTIVEQPIAERWGKILPKLRFDRQLVISEPGEEYWFVRRDASMLRASPGFPMARAARSIKSR